MPSSPARSIIDVGSVIADTYTIEALIGRGGMGAVFLASHKRLPGKQVAIKMLHAELSGDEVLARFKREAEIASRLGHPNIVTVHDFNVLPDGTPYLVLEFLEGESLAQRLARGPLSLDQAWSVIRQIGSALAAAHREGIVHRDLKPQNIFLVPTEVDGKLVEIAKVLDFGISKIRGSQTVKTQESALLGTPQYMAPEQATGQHASVDERTDVFALGAIVYEMLAGHPAFSGASIPEVVFKVVYEQPAPLGDQVPNLPAAIAKAVHRAMAKPAGERFSTVSAFVEALTGQPLAIGRTSHAADPGAVTPSTGKDAFAQTVGSGDHAESVVVAPPARGSAPTVATGNVVPTTPAPLRRSSRWIAAGVIVGGAAIAATAIYFALWTTDRPGRERRGATIAPVVVAAVADAAVPEPVEASKPKLVEPARVDPVKPAKPTSPPKPPPTDHLDDVTTKQHLDEASAAIEAKDFARAEQLANGVLGGESSTPGQRLRAYSIHGVVQCAAHNNEELARADLRKLDGAPKLRRNLLDVCHARGFLDGDR